MTTARRYSGVASTPARHGRQSAGNVDRQDGQGPTGATAILAVRVDKMREGAGHRPIIKTTKSAVAIARNGGGDLISATRRSGLVGCRLMQLELVRRHVGVQLPEVPHSHSDLICMSRLGGGGKRRDGF